MRKEKRDDHHINQSQNRITDSVFYDCFIHMKLPNYFLAGYSGLVPFWAILAKMGQMLHIKKGGESSKMRQMRQSKKECLVY